MRLNLFTSKMAFCHRLKISVVNVGAFSESSSSSSSMSTPSSSSSSSSSSTTSKLSNSGSGKREWTRAGVRQSEPHREAVELAGEGERAEGERESGEAVDWERYT